MPRVLHIVGNQGEIGGAEVSLIRSVRALPEGEFAARCVVVVDGPPRETPVVARFQAEGIDAEVVPMSGKLDPRGWSAVSRAWRRAAPDLVHTHGERALLLRWGVDPFGRAPWVHTVHGWVAETSRDRRASVAVARSLLRAADRVICVSEGLREGLPAVPEGRRVVLPNAAPDLPRIRPGAGDEFRAHFGLGPSAPLVCWIGRLSPEKDPLAALAVAASVRASIPGARFVVVGGGELLPDLRAAVEEGGPGAGVSVMGPLVDPSPALAAADLLLLTSRTEADPLVVLEAAAHAVPVVAPAVGGIPGMLADGVTGRVVAGGADALAGAVVELLSDPARRRAMGVAARRDLAGGLRVPRRHGEALASLYRDVLGARRRGAPRERDLPGNRGART
ncbi:glycosyltransferase [Myxococcota bacterium]|nr:glycosyltransferase [Myxococcota bacterium]